MSGEFGLCGVLDAGVGVVGELLQGVVVLGGVCEEGDGGDAFEGVQVGLGGFLLGVGLGGLGVCFGEGVVGAGSGGGAVVFCVEYVAGGLAQPWVLWVVDESGVGEEGGGGDGGLFVGGGLFEEFSDLLGEVSVVGVDGEVLEGVVAGGGVGVALEEVLELLVVAGGIGVARSEVGHEVVFEPEGVGGGELGGVCFLVEVGVKGADLFLGVGELGFELGEACGDIGWAGAEDGLELRMENGGLSIRNWWGAVWGGN